MPLYTPPDTLLIVQHEVNFNFRRSCMSNDCVFFHPPPKAPRRRSTLQECLLRSRRLSPPCQARVISSAGGARPRQGFLEPTQGILRLVWWWHQNQSFCCRSTKKTIFRFFSVRWYAGVLQRYAARSYGPAVGVKAESRCLMGGVDHSSTSCTAPKR